MGNGSLHYPGSAGHGTRLAIWIVGIVCACLLFLICFCVYMSHYRIESDEIPRARSRREYLRRLLIETFTLSEIREARLRVRLHHAFRQASLPQEEEGLTSSDLAGLPVFRFKQGSPAKPMEGYLANEENCMVCLAEFKAGETGRILPQCSHYFHADCVDMWFLSHTTCPHCRSTAKRPSEAAPDSTPAACFPESTTGAEDGLQDAVNVSGGLSSGTNPSETSNSEETPSAQPTLDVARGEHVGQELGDYVAIQIRDNADVEPTSDRNRGENLDKEFGDAVSIQIRGNADTESRSD